MYSFAIKNGIFKNSVIIFFRITSPYKHEPEKAGEKSFHLQNYLDIPQNLPTYLFEKAASHNHLKYYAMEISGGWPGGVLFREGKFSAEYILKTQGLICIELILKPNEY